jgi:hypothetical protein
MAKKKKSELSVMINKYLQEFISYILSSLEVSTENLIKRFSDIVRLKERVRRNIISLSISIAAIIVIMLGLGEFIVSFFPFVRQGIAQIIVGTAFLLIAWLYKKSW